MIGSDVLYICGTDDHGVANTLAAEKEGVPYKEFVDRGYAVWKRVCDLLGISFDNFSQTSRKDPHYPLSQEFFLRLLKNGKILRRDVKQLFSPKTGRFLADRYVVGECYRCGHKEARQATSARSAARGSRRPSSATRAAGPTPRTASSCGTPGSSSWTSPGSRPATATPAAGPAAATLLLVVLASGPARSFGPGMGAGRNPHGLSNMSIASQALAYVDAFYVDPKRIEPIVLLESAFRSLEGQYPEVIVDLSEDKRSVSVRAQGFERTFDLTGASGPTGTAAAIDEVAGFLGERLDLSEDERTKLVYLAINGAFRALDPHTNIFSTKHFKDFKVSTRGSFGGIGFTFRNSCHIIPPYRLLLRLHRLPPDRTDQAAARRAYGEAHRPAGAELINQEGAIVRMPVRGHEGLVEVNSRQIPGSLSADGPANIDPSQYDLVALAMQEPQYRLPGVRELLDRVARSKRPCMSIMNMPPLPYIARIPGLSVDKLRDSYTDAAVWDSFDPACMTLCSPDPQAFRPPEDKVNVLQVDSVRRSTVAAPPDYDSPRFLGAWTGSISRVSDGSR